MGQRTRVVPPPTDEELVQYLERLDEEEENPETRRLVAGLLAAMRIIQRMPEETRAQLTPPPPSKPPSGPPGPPPPPPRPTPPPVSRPRFGSRIDELLHIQSEDLAALQDREAKRMLQAYEDARRSLLERLKRIDPDATPATAQRVRVMQAQVERGIQEMRERLGVVLAEAEKRAHDKSLQDLIDTIKANEPDFVDVGPNIEVQAVNRLNRVRGLLLHQHSIDRYGLELVEEIQRRIVSGVVQGMSPTELARTIAGADRSIFAAKRGRAMLIARMEVSRAYDEGHRVAIDEWAALDDPAEEDPALKRIDEFFDQRNHPISRALHGKVARPNEEFEVHISEIPGGVTSGITWQRTGGVFHGLGMPAHFNERGRVTPFRASWVGQKFVEPVSRRAEPLKDGDRRALRALARGEQPDTTGPGARRLRLHGLATMRGDTLVPTPKGLAEAAR